MDDEGNLEKEATLYIYLYLHPVLFIIGFFANILSGITLLRLSQKTLSTCIYLGVICFMDVLILYIQCGNTWITQVSGVNYEDALQKSSKTLCKLVPFITNLCTHYITWTMAAFAVESLLMTVLRDGVSRVCTMTRTRAAMFLLIVLLVSFDAHSFWTSNLLDAKDVPKLKETICAYTKPGRKHKEDVRDSTWPLIELILMYILPYTIVLVCTVYKVIKLKDRKRCDRHIALTNDDDNKPNKSTYILPGTAQAEQTLRSLFIHVLYFYLIAISPLIAYKIYDVTSVEKNDDDQEDDEKKKIDDKSEAIRVFVRNVCSLSYHFYISFKLLIFLYASEPFRRQFVNVLSWLDCKKWCYNNRVNNGSQMVAPLIVHPVNSLQEQAATNVVTTV